MGHMRSFSWNNFLRWLSDYGHEPCTKWHMWGINPSHMYSVSSSSTISNKIYTSWDGIPRFSCLQQREYHLTFKGTFGCMLVWNAHSFWDSAPFRRLNNVPRIWCPEIVDICLSYFSIRPPNCLGVCVHRSLPLFRSSIVWREIMPCNSLVFVQSTVSHFITANRDH